MSIIGRIMERIVHEQIMLCLLRYSLLSPSQHGFLAGKSSITNVLQTTSQWAFSLDRGESVDVLYLNLSKAFGWNFFQDSSQKFNGTNCP